MGDDQHIDKVAGLDCIHRRSTGVIAQSFHIHEMKNFSDLYREKDLRNSFRFFP